MTEAPKRGLPPSHPGRHLADALDGLKAQTGISRDAAAKRMGIGRRSLYNVIEGAVRVTPDLAVRLEAFGLGSAESWLNLQQAYDLAIARELLRQDVPIEAAWPVKRSAVAA